MDSFDLFPVMASDPLLDTPGLYTGSIDLPGGMEGVDGYDGSVQNLTDSAEFSVMVEGATPEPSTLLLGLAGGVTQPTRIVRAGKLDAVVADSSPPAHHSLWLF